MSATASVAPAKRAGERVVPAAARWLAWAALAAGAALRFWALTASSLWSDEGNTWAVVQRAFGQIARDAAADIHPPLYYWLLKIWAAPGDYSAWSLRAFSALCGVALIALVWQVARQASNIEYHVSSREAAALDTRYWMPPLAAWVAALNPFQIYYSQEARMYMLLAVEAAGLLALLLALLARERAGGRTWPLLLGYAAVAVAGLWTHYSFPIVLAALGLAWLIDWLRRARRSGRALLAFAAANLIALLAFAPWLPTAIRQITTWPQGGQSVGLAEGLRLTLHTLLFGLMRPTPQPEWPWLLAVGLLPVLGLVALRRSRGVWPVALLLAAPVILMAALGLFTDAFLKFLLVASAPWCVLVAAAPEITAPALGDNPRLTGVLRATVGLGALLLAALTLPGYYTNPAARDNYKGIAAALVADADPATDLVILDAPGQLDVWRYYDPGIPTLSLPGPPSAEPGDFVTQLQEAVGGKRRVYTLYWATDEADPQGSVESFLDGTLYKGLESWQGNVRFAVYFGAGRTECHPAAVAPWHPVALEQVCQPGEPREMAQEVRAGEPAIVKLVWRALEAPAGDLAVSVQMLDGRGQVIAQRDAPLGASAGTTVRKRYALLVPPGTPPGEYVLIAALYDPATGVRLTGPAGDMLPLGSVRVLPGGAAELSALLPLQHRTDTALGPATLLGYDLYKKGFAHAPETPLTPGDLLHLTLYWQAGSSGLPDDITFTLTLGDQRLAAPLAGGIYPTSKWQTGQIVRGEFDILYDGTARRPVLTVGDDSLRLARVP